MSKDKLGNVPPHDLSHENPRPELFLPDPINGEGFKLPRPPTNAYLSTINFDSESGGEAGAPPAGGGSGRDGLDLIGNFVRGRSESQCTICEGRKEVVAFVSQGRGWSEIRCPMCSGKGTLGTLRNPKRFEEKEILSLLRGLVFDVQTPLIVQEGELVTVCLRRLFFGFGDLEPKPEPSSGVTFLLASVSRAKDRAKLALGLNYQFAILADQMLITTEFQASGDLILTIHGLKTGFESLRIEPSIRSGNSDKHRPYDFGPKLSGSEHEDPDVGGQVGTVELGKSYFDRLTGGVIRKISMLDRWLGKKDKQANDRGH